MQGVKYLAQINDFRVVFEQSLTIAVRQFPRNQADKYIVAAYCKNGEWFAISAVLVHAQGPNGPAIVRIDYVGAPGNIFFVLGPNRLSSVWGLVRAFCVDDAVLREGDMPTLYKVLLDMCK